MAHLVPSDITRLALAGAHTPELATLEQLQALPDAYTVFHSVHWSLEYARDTRFGEIDFVIVNRSGDVLVIEQKNGTLEETDGELIKQYADRDKNVGEQVHRSIDSLHRKFAHLHGPQRKLSVDYLIYCPDHRLTRINSTSLAPARIVDARAAPELVARIEAVLGPGLDRDPRWRETVLGFFYQSYEVVPDVHAHVQAQERAFTRLSGGLLKVVDRLEMQPFRLRVCGVAGSGKSQVARHVYGRAIEAGRRPLLVCYNRPLRDRLAASLGPEAQVFTWHGLCDSFLKALGHRLDYRAMKSDPRFWEAVQEQVVGERIPEAWRFDTVIVDEGQDFEREWYDILRLFARDDAEVLWLEDPDQNVRRTEPAWTEEFVTYHGRENYRTPARIAQFIQDTLPFEFECANALPGLGVQVTPYEDEKSHRKALAARVRALLKLGFAAEDIVVLTCRGINNSSVSELNEIAGLKLRRFTGEYTADGSQVLTEGRLYAESVYRFKGQQAPAVVLTDIDGADDAEHRRRLERLIYTGATRATVRLELLVKAEGPGNRALLEAGDA